MTVIALNDAFRDPIAELIAGYTANASGQLDEATGHAAKRVLMDSLAVSLGALSHPAARAARRHAYRFEAAGHGCVLWGSEKRTTPEIAALANGVLLRCYDYNDFFVGQRNSGHPSDIVAGVIAAAEWLDVSGAELLSALAIGYEVVAAAFDAFSTATGEWDYTNLTALGGACAIARLLRLNADQTREALAMTVIPHLASDEIESGDLNRRGDLTMWKRFNGSDAIRNALQACLLASVGVEGAVRPFTGKFGFVKKLKIGWDPLPILAERLDPLVPARRIADTFMKRWPVGSVAQSAIRAALQARSQIGDISQIEKVRVFAEEGAYDHLVHIRAAPYEPISRETADHSLPYIVAAAILDGNILTNSFDLDRVMDPARREFLKERVTVSPAPELGTIAGGKHKRAADGYLSRVEIELKNGLVAHGDALPFPGHPRAPFTDAELEAKFRDNAEPFTGKALATKLVDTQLSVERLPSVRTLTVLMSFKSVIDIDPPA